MLIEYGASVNVADYITRTALHMANQNGNNAYVWKHICNWIDVEK